jgi:hypothetical protein
MPLASRCIRTDDPAFIAAFGLGIAFAVLLARTLVELETKLASRDLAWLYRSVAWLAAEGLAFVVPIALTALLDKWQRPERSLCTSLVWRWYFVPPVALVVIGIAWGILRAAAQRRATGHA